ncbi:MAG: hypothetical protein JWM47_2257 [Acidimicrobiales bacterium]|nr:hypothetical protein [Acidimicrobiales bacterium]
MLLIREVARVVRDVVCFALATRRLGIVVIVTLVAAILLLSATITTVGPVALYPLL